MAPLVRTGGSRHTGLAALPHRNIHPNGFLVMLASAVIAHLLLSKTVFGRYAYAIGSNEEATRLSGVNVDKWKILQYVLCGTM